MARLVLCPACILSLLSTISTKSLAVRNGVERRGGEGTRKSPLDGEYIPITCFANLLLDPSFFNLSSCLPDISSRNVHTPATGPNSFLFQFRRFKKQAAIGQWEREWELGMGGLLGSSKDDRLNLLALVSLQPTHSLSCSATRSQAQS